MIAAKYVTDEGQQVLILVLEPGNIEKLKSGEPIHKFLGEFVPELARVELMLAYTPDATWVAQQVQANPGTLGEAIKESLSRPEVLVRGKSAEDMKRTI